MSGIANTGIRRLDNGIELCLLDCGNRSFPPHFHKYWLIGCLLQGRRHFIYNGQECLLEPFTLVALNPGQIHACASIHNSACKSAGEHTRASQDIWVCAHIPREAFDEIFPLGSIDLPHFSRNIFYEHAIARLLAAMARRDFTPAAAIHNFKRLLPGLLCSSSAKPSPPSGAKRAGGEARAIDGICRQLDANVEEAACLEEMAAWAGMDKFRLLRKFARERGITPYRYLESLRIAKAAGMLRQRASLAETALACGFYDQSHFCRCFKRYTGLTPGAFRLGESKAEKGGGVA